MITLTRFDDLREAYRARDLRQGGEAQRQVEDPLGPGQAAVAAHGTDARAVVLGAGFIGVELLKGSEIDVDLRSTRARTTGSTGPSTSTR